MAGGALGSSTNSRIPSTGTNSDWKMKRKTNKNPAGARKTGACVTRFRTSWHLDSVDDVDALRSLNRAVEVQCPKPEQKGGKWPETFDFLGFNKSPQRALQLSTWTFGRFHETHQRRSSVDKIDFKSPKGLALIDKFLKTTNYEFECSSIVGRKFESVDDHADYVCNGGCSDLIDALVAECASS